MRKAVKPPKLAKCEELNISKIAIKFSTMLSKDMVFSGLRDIVTRIGEAVTEGQEVAIAFCVGVFHSKDRRVAFQFDPKMFPIIRGMMAGTPVEGSSPLETVEEGGTEIADDMSALNIDGAAVDSFSNTSNNGYDEASAAESRAGEAPRDFFNESEAGDDFVDDVEPPEVPELGFEPATDESQYNRAAQMRTDRTGTSMMSEVSSLMGGLGVGSQVEEEAYRRHLEYVQQMVEESAFEKSQFVQNLQNQELDARERRQQKRRDNKQLQTFLRKQVKERSEKTRERRHKDLTTKTHCSFPPLVHSAANGVPGGLCRMTSSEQQKRVLMRAALKTQMEAKANIHNAERQRQLEEERQYLQQVQDRMLEGQQRMQVKQAAVKKKLLQAWERDKKMKQLLRQGIQLQSTIRNDTLLTSRSSMSGYSIGYDQRL